MRVFKNRALFFILLAFTTLTVVAGAQDAPVTPPPDTTPDPAKDAAAKDAKNPTTPPSPGPVTCGQRSGETPPPSSR